MDRTERDKFEVIGAIPKGKSYQWVAESVLGNKAPAEWSYKAMLAGGWKPVPARRHPKMPRHSGRIVLDGQVLMERSANASIKALAASVAAAIAMHDGHPASRPVKGPHATAPTYKWSLIEATESKDYWKRLEEAKAEAAATNFEFPVQFTISATDRDVDAAATCALTVSEYMRRKFSDIARVMDGYGWHGPHGQAPVIIFRELRPGVLEHIPGLKVAA